MFSNKKKSTRLKELESRVAALEKERDELRAALTEAKRSSARQDTSCTRPSFGSPPQDCSSPSHRSRPSEFMGAVSSANISLLAAAEDAVKATSCQLPKTGFDDRYSEDLEVKHITDTHRLSSNGFPPEDVSDNNAEKNLLNFGDPALFEGNVVLTFQPDSPAHRRQVATLAANVEALRERLQRLVRRARDYVRAGNEYSRLGRLFAAELVDVHFRNAPKSGSAVRVGDLGPVLAELGSTIEEIQSYRDAYLVSFETTFCAPMEAFVKREIKGVRQMKVESQKSLEEHEQNLAKLLQLRNDADAALVAQRKLAACASYKRHEMARFDFVHELNQLEMKKKFQLVERVCNGLYAELGYFHQCHIVMASVEPNMRDLQLALQLARKKFAGEDRIWAAKRKQLELRLEKAENSGKDMAKEVAEKWKWSSLSERASAKSSLRLRRSVARGLKKASSPRPQVDSGGKGQAKLTLEHEEREKSTASHNAEDPHTQPSASWTPSARKAPSPPTNTPDFLVSRPAGHRRSYSENAAGPANSTPSATNLASCSSSASFASTGDAGHYSPSFMRFSSETSSDEADSTGEQETAIRRGSGGDLDHVVAAAAASGTEEDSVVDPASSSYVVKKGYLWKRSSNVRKDWKRRYFKIMAGKLLYEKLEEGPPTKVCDIMLCTVRERVKRHANLFSFEILSPGNRTFVLQAESREHMEAWIQVIREQTESLIVSTDCAFTDPSAAENCTFEHSSGRLSNTAPPEFVKALMDANMVCVDCGKPRPDWCSINLGVLMCIECSGVHRALGAHISKVRSLTLDVLSSESFGVMECLGNDSINKIFEGRLKATGANKIGPTAAREDREKFIRDKYEKCKFVKHQRVEEPQRMLYTAAAEGDMQGAIQAIVAGADVNAGLIDASLNTALHAAAANGHHLMIELLWQNGANPDVLNAAEKAPLDLATEGAHGQAISILLHKLEGP